MSEYYESFPTRPCLCDRCGTDRVCIIVYDDTLFDEKGGLAHPVVTPFACPKCDVYLIFCVDTGPPGGIWEVISRSPTSGHWDWLPESMRAPAAKAGFTIRQNGPPLPKRFFLDLAGTTWISDGRNAFNMRQKTEDPTAEPASRALQATWPSWCTGTALELSAPYTRRTGEPLVVDCGDIVIPANMVTFVSELYPGAMWEAAGVRAPAVALLEGVPVAFVMPVADLPVGPG